MTSGYIALVLSDIIFHLTSNLVLYFIYQLVSYYLDYDKKMKILVFSLFFTFIVGTRCIQLASDSNFSVDESKVFKREIRMQNGRITEVDIILTANVKTQIPLLIKYLILCIERDKKMYCHWTGRRSRIYQYAILTLCAIIQSNIINELKFNLSFSSVK